MVDNVCLGRSKPTSWHSQSPTTRSAWPRHLLNWREADGKGHHAVWPTTPLVRDLSEAMAITQKPRLALVIVRAGHAATFDWLCRRYGGKAIIIEDRRLRDRRQSGPRPGVRLPGTERRSGGERRRPLTLSEAPLERGGL
jgi:hypothetical protein